MGKDVMRLAGEPSRIPVSGELSPVVEDFRRVLAEGGFNRHTVATHTHLIADLSRWLTGRGLTAAQFTVDELPVFLADRRSAGRTALVSARGAAPMMAFLRERGLIPAASLPSPTGPVGQLVADYRRYLDSERGLAPLSILRYLTTARLFLTALPEPLTTTLLDLSAAQVIAFVMDEAPRRRAWSAKSLVTALRALLRFLHVAGHAPDGLAAQCRRSPGGGFVHLPAASRGICSRPCCRAATGTSRWVAATTRSC